MLDCLDQQENLGTAWEDSRIKTALLSHQRTGVGFIGQKEGWREPTVPSLWERHQKNGTMFYEHIIVGTRMSSPLPETFGGILADEMGLGKTLTVLSAIVGSLEWAYNSTNLQAHESSPLTSSCKRPIKGTLIVVPSVLVLDEWLKEIQGHITPNSLKVLKYHGRKREYTIAELLNFDIVLSTYATVACEFGRGSGPLYEIIWFRIILDEAHLIRHQRTKQFRAIAALSALHRWCMTGTPVQNSLLDLGALLRFLRVPLLDKASTFRDHVVKPIEAGDGIGFKNLRNILKSICLRRIKDLLHLPEPEEITYELELSPVEREMYYSIGESSKQAIDDVVSGRKNMEAYNGILQAIMQLRLLCNHGTFEEIFQRTRVAGIPDPDEALALLEEKDDAICTICSSDITSVSNHGLNAGRFTTCSHLLCNVCFAQYEEDLERQVIEETSYCLICQAPITEIRSTVRHEIQPDMISPDVLNVGLSTKLFNLLEDVNRFRCSCKSIIFSSWKKTLYIIAALLTAHRIPFVQIDGSLPLPERRRILNNFEENGQILVLLMTLGTGAVGYVVKAFFLHTDNQCSQ